MSGERSAPSWREEKEIDRQQLLGLYGDAGWSAYTAYPDVLVDAVGNSLYVVSAWRGDLLIGLVRVVGDGLTIAYIQDILVRREFKRQGIGTALMKMALDRFSHVRQVVLLTDDTQETRGFYESLGFESCDSGGLVSFIRVHQS
jgi:ribosomal protein S18 acetylase RimI-like enzyme